MKRLLYLAMLAMVVSLVMAPAALAQSRGPSGADGSYNCEDFDDQGQAQQYFNSAGPGDPDGLDADDDGQACEGLPTIVNDGTPDGAAIPGEGEGATDDQYDTPDTGATGDQYVATAAEEPPTATGALPSTGGPALLIPAAVLLLGTGLLGMRIIRR